MIEILMLFDFKDVFKFKKQSFINVRHNFDNSILLKRETVTIFYENNGYPIFYINAYNDGKCELYIKPLYLWKDYKYDIQGIDHVKVFENLRKGRTIEN